MFSREKLKERPTPVQIRTLKKFGLKPPSTKDACASFIVWLQTGGAAAAVAKAAAIKEAQAHWSGKTVRRGAHQGLVLYVVRAVPHLTFQAGALNQEEGGHFRVVVAWANGFVSTVSTLKLEII